MTPVLKIPTPVREIEVDDLPLENGDHLDQPTFHRLYRAMPPGIKCELIGGIAYVMASPLKFEHSFAHIFANNWLYTYFAATPGTFPTDNATHLLGGDSELQPVCRSKLPVRQVCRPRRPIRTTIR